MGSPSHYNTTVIPARARKPKDKALVENQVKLIYNRVYARLRNLQFFDLDSINQAIKEKARDHNQLRMQVNPYCREESTPRIKSIYALITSLHRGVKDGYRKGNG